MSNDKKDWKLNIPDDPNKPSSYSSSYVRKAPTEGNMTKESFEDMLKRVSRKLTPSEHDSSKSRT